METRVAIFDSFYKQIAWRVARLLTAGSKQRGWSEDRARCGESMSWPRISTHLTVTGMVDGRRICVAARPGGQRAALVDPLKDAP
jgi:hypothetical protein